MRLTFALANPPVVTIELLHRPAQELRPKRLGRVLVQPQLLVDPPDGALAEARLEVLQEIRSVLIPLVPVFLWSEG